LEPGLRIDDQNLAIPYDLLNAKVSDLVDSNGELDAANSVTEICCNSGADVNKFSVPAMYNLLCKFDTVENDTICFEA
jgi:hypothetical protein